MNVNPTLTSFTSLTLLGKIRDLSDQQAWSEFVRRYAPKIFSWCKRFSLQDQDATDVTQQVLLKLVSAMESFEYDPSRGSFRGWLKTVTSNAVRDFCRKRSSTNEFTGQGAEKWLEQMVDESSVDALAEQIEAGYREELLAEAESRAQLRVNPKTWEIYCLISKEGYSAGEAAKKLGIKVADTYVAKSRVVKMLREIVTQLEQLN